MRNYLSILLTIIIFGLPSYLFSKNVALFIAVDDYTISDAPVLKSSVKGAEAMRELLENQYEFTETTILYNKDATQEKIIETTKDILSTLTEKDNFLLFYAGHGVKIKNQGYWIPIDATDITQESELVSNTEIQAIFGKSKVNHILAVIDGCFAGKNFNASSLVLSNRTEPDYYTRIEQLMSRQGIVSGSLSPTENTGEQYSVFVKYLLRFLERNKKRNYDVGQLFDIIKLSVSANSDNTPRLGHIQNTGHEGGQFIFYKTSGEIPVSEQPVTPVKTVATTKEKCNLVVSLREGKIIEFGIDGGTLTAWTNKSNVKFDWLKDGNTLRASTLNLRVKESGVYTVVVDAGEGCMERASIKVEVKEPEVNLLILEGAYIEFTMKGKLRAKSDIEDGIYIWRRNGFTIGSGNVLEVYESGTYTVILRRSDGRVMANYSTEVLIKDRLYYLSKDEDVVGIAKMFYRDASKAKLIQAANEKILKGRLIAKKGMELVIPNDDTGNKALPPMINIVGASAFAPFSGVGLHEQGMLTNIVKEVFKEIDIKMGMEFLNWSEARTGTVGGKYAASFPMVKINQEATDVLFSEPIFTVLNVLFVKKGSTIDFSKPNKLNGNVVAVQKGYEIKKLLEYNDKKYIQIRWCESLNECFELLKKGEVSMVATSQMAGWGLIETSKNLLKKDFEMLRQTLETSTLHFAISRQYLGAEQIMTKFNESLRRLKNSGEYDKIRDIHIDLFQKKLDRP